jgi:hypothetical protein
LRETKKETHGGRPARPEVDLALGQVGPGLATGEAGRGF